MLRFLSWKVIHDSVGEPAGSVSTKFGTKSVKRNTDGSDGRTLSFSIADGKLVDDQTGSEWDPASGKATAGPLKGSQLAPEVGVVSFRRAWRDFHPRSSYWRPH
jgi:hypothetical protein